MSRAIGRTPPLLLLALAVPFAGGIAAAASPGFQVSYALADGVAHGLADGGAIPFPAADINSTTAATIFLVNQGDAAGAINGLSISGAGFRLNGAPPLPATVAAGASAVFSIVFAPTQPGAYTGVFRFNLSGRTLSGTLSGSTAASNIGLSYLDPDTNNVVPLGNGATVQFPGTAVGAGTSIVLIASNTGAGTGILSAVAVADGGTAFQLQNVPALPAPVTPSAQVRFAVRFTPPRQQNFAAVLSLTVDGGAVTVNLQGAGIGPQFTYAYDSTALQPNGAIAFGDVAVGQSAGVTVQAANTGAGDGQIAAITISGAGLALSNLPALPATLHPNASQKFTLTFAPTSPGPVNGRLLIGGDSFNVTANGVGPRLNFSFTSSGTAVPVSDGGFVLFVPQTVGTSSTVDFSVQNTGTAAAAISIIAVTSGAVFTLPSPPSLPLTLAPGESLSFPVKFAPNATGALTSTLRINAASLTLSGSGSPPAALPSYNFQTAGTVSQPAQQPTVGVNLASPYAQTIQGTLKLTFEPDAFVDDPAIQFATGGRTASFTIPANTTQALFNGNTSIPLQTGTTAGAITLTPSFAMQSGFDLTPPGADTLTIAIPRMAPRVLGAQVGNVTLSGFSLVLTGYSTSRNLQKLDIDVAPRSGEKFSNTHLTLDVSGGAGSWYQATASQATGGAFLVTIPFALSNGSNTDDLVHKLQSLTITATNDVGSSSAVTVNIP